MDVLVDIWLMSEVAPLTFFLLLTELDLHFMYQHIIHIEFHVFSVCMSLLDTVLRTKYTFNSLHSQQSPHFLVFAYIF